MAPGTMRRPSSTSSTRCSAGAAVYVVQYFNTLFLVLRVDHLQRFNFERLMREMSVPIMLETIGFSSFIR